ncbi:MAG: hypothetical protein Q4A65_01335 [Bacillota bacterium]|nr:hypothetical protein [Bacillota bacterium]
MATDTDGNFDRKAFATYMALNTGLSGGMGGAIGGIGAKMTQKNAKEYLSLAAKINVGTKLSDEEMLKFAKLQDKFDSARQGNDVAKADIINRADYDARVHDAVFSRGGNSVDAEAAMNGATTHSEKMSYARTIKDTAEQEFDTLRTQREQLVSKLKDASPEEAIDIRKKLTANRRELDRLGGIANVAERELEIAEKKNRRAVQDLAVSAGKMSESTGVNYRVMNDKDMRKIISEQMAKEADGIEAKLGEIPEAERANAMAQIEELRKGATDDYFYKGFYTSQLICTIHLSMTTP